MMTWLRDAPALKALGLLAVLSFAVTACAENPKGSAGAAVGAAAGGLIGAAAGGGAEGIAAGVLLGGLLGGSVGSALDAQDRRLAARTTQRALEYQPTGERTTWRNPDTGHRGWTEPTRTYTRPSGEPCREFQQVVIIGGREEEAYGTACRQPDGDWKIVSTQ
ncbi:MAG: RT0821/Lpp0805 family surface protein [Rhodothalassiaceae bacterium]